MVVATIVLADKGQDFTELDLLENGVILGNSLIFENGRLSLLGIGTNDGMVYHSCGSILEDKQVVNQSVVTKKSPQFVYFYETGAETPMPWDASIFKYAVVAVTKAEKVDRFIK